jgi:phage-related protein
MKGITFGNYHSFRDFRLILSPNNAIGTPTPKYELIDIPGGDGMLDFTEAFGEVKYGNRPMSFEFSTMVPQTEFLSLFATVQSALHGQKMKIILDDDPDFYYMGRITVSEWKASRLIGKLTIDCDCEPFKYKAQKTVVSATLDGTSNNLYDFNKLTLPVTIAKNNDGFLDLNADNTIGSGIMYPTIFHSLHETGEIDPNQAMSLVVEIRKSSTVPESGIYFYFTNYYAPQPDYFSPTSYPVLFTNTESKIIVLPATIKDGAIANAAFFMRSYFSVQPTASIKASFRLSVVKGTVKPDDFVYASADGTMKGLRLINGKKRVVPAIAATAPFTLYHEGNTYSITAGTTTIPEIELKEGVNDIAVKGTGTITFTYQEGVL